MDIVQKCLDHPPVDTKFLFGLHRNSLSTRGLQHELKVNLSKLIRNSNNPKKFMILTHARSGSTLLQQLMGSHPAIECHGEIFNHRVLSPHRFLDAYEKKSALSVFGFKMLSFQMIQVMRLKNPVSFLTKLQDEKGYKFIYLERNALDRMMSLKMASATGKYHTKTASKLSTFCFDKKDIERRLRWNILLNQYLEFITSKIDCLKVHYDIDLQPESINKTMNQIFSMLGVKPFEAKAGLKKILPNNHSDYVENWEQILNHLDQSGLSDFIRT